MLTGVTYRRADEILLVIEYFTDGKNAQNCFVWYKISKECY